jgi:hypothetical protein
MSPFIFGSRSWRPGQPRAESERGPRMALDPRGAIVVETLELTLGTRAPETDTRCERVCVDDRYGPPVGAALS